MRAEHFHLRCDAGLVNPVLDELIEIANRRASLPEFRQRLFEIDAMLDGALETSWVDGDAVATSAGELVLRLQFGQAFLDRVAALRAFDRDFDGHGASV